MNRASRWIAVIALGAGSLAWAHEGGKEMGKGDTTKQGEVLDLACYMGHEAKGEKHKDCAQMCITAGAPMGLLTSDGKVYLLVEDHTNNAAYKAVKGWAAEKVKITGDEVSRGGLQAIVVEKAQKV